MITNAIYTTNAANLILSLTPAAEQTGSNYSVIVIVTDTNDFDVVTPHLSATNSFTISVFDPIGMAPLARAKIALDLKNRVSLSMHGQIGANCIIQTATNLNPTATWTDLGTNKIVSDPFIFLEPRLTNGNRFYRVRIVP